MRILVITICALFYTLAPAHAQDSLLDIQQIRSPGGVEAWLVEDHSVPVIAIKFAFKDAGAALEPADKQGLSRLLSNTLDEGAGELDSQTFQKELRDLAIELSFSSGRDSFNGSLKTLTKNKDRAFELLQLALTKPRFDEEAVNRMREANQSRIRSSLADPEWIAARFLNDKAFEGHPYAQNSGGTLTSLEAITTDDLRGFLKNLSQDRLVVAVSGDITAEELRGVLDEIFTALPLTSTAQDIPDLKLQNQGKSFVYKQDIPQTIIEILQPGLDRNDPDYHGAQVMNFILGSSGFGSRLTKAIREDRGLTYGIYTYFMDMKHLDTLAISTSTNNESAAELLRLVREEWRKIKDEPVSDQELKDAQTYLIGSLPLSLTSTDSIAGLLLSLQLDGLPVNYLDKREREIKSTTKSAVQNVARRILDSGQFVTIMVGQPEGIEGAQTLESIPNVE